MERELDFLERKLFTSFSRGRWHVISMRYAVQRSPVVSRIARALDVSARASESGGWPWPELFVTKS